MHELSLVNGILQAVEETAREEKGRVRSFKVGVGELAQFDLRLVRQLLVDSRRGTQLQDVEVAVEVEQSKIRCMSCGKEWSFRQLSGQMSEEQKEMVHFLPELLSSFAKCPSCSRSFFEIEEGRSVRLVEVVFDD